MSQRSAWKTGARACLALAAVCLVLPGLSGCKTSDTLFEIVFDQDAQQVEDDTNSRFVKNLLDALQMTDTLPELTKDEDADIERDRVQEEAVQGKDESDERAPTADYAQSASSKSATRAQGSGSTESSTQAKGRRRGSSSRGDGKNSKSHGKDANPNKGGNGTKRGNGDGTVYRGDGGTGAVYGEDGNYSELPEGVQASVAFGECANMVVSFAGKHALAGADKGFLGNSFIKKAYAKKDIANAKTISIGSRGVIDADQVAKIRPDAVLIQNGSYTLSKDGLAKLKAKNIDVVYLPAMDTADHIKVAAESIGKMYGGAEDTLSGDDAQAAAQEYVKWHDDLVDGLVSEHGGLVGSLDYGTGAKTGVAGKHTVYLHEWDNATYHASPDYKSIWDDSGGVGISKVGYRWSPMSYYLSVGGTENVGADFKSTLYGVSAKYYIWQFNLGRVATSRSHWSGRGVDVSALANHGTDDLLVRAGDGSQLGSSSFPYVVARSRAVAASMRDSESRGTKRQTGLYAVYDKSLGGRRGFLSATGKACYSYIDGRFDVEVNPCGLYSSWIDGSPESPLEAVWANDLNTGGSELSGKIKAYYKMFYGVNLTSRQIETIVAGERS